MPPQHILIVEDDKHIAQLVQYNLEKANFSCQTAITGEEALDVLDRDPVDLVILDIMLPKMNGLDVCRMMKQDQRWAAIPVIMLTAKGEEVDRIIGFELGADDYVVKPFSPRELILRVKSILKRGEPRPSLKEILSLGGIKVDIPRCKVMVQGKEVKLTAMEFKLLTILLQKQGRVQSREALLEDVWNMATDVTTRTVDTHVKRLRQKLGAMGKYIETVRGYGYRMCDEETDCA